jgi:hypothetical protein
MATESNVLLTDSKTMVTKSKIFSMSFRTQRRGDVEPPSSAECATTSPQAWQIAADQGAVESTRSRVRWS